MKHKCHIVVTIYLKFKPQSLRLTMRYLITFRILGLFLLIASSVSTLVKAESPHTFKLAFGSCAVETKPQTIWSDIQKQNPDVFLFVGDNHYADVIVVDGKRKQKMVDNKERFSEAYSDLAAIPEFSEFRSRVPLLMATWDDHDYGNNDAGKEYPYKALSQTMFLDFFGFAKDDPIRQQEGIYHSKTLEHSGNRIQIIMLDTRYHRDPLIRLEQRIKGKGPYGNNEDKSASLLGQQQWIWLKEQLQKPADVRFVVSSIQVVAHEHAWESWGRMPHQRQALYDLIAQTKANGVIFLSGDRHLFEISKDEGQLGNKVPYPMWDFTSSGLTQSFSEIVEQNSFRQSEVVRDTNYGLLEVNWDNNDILNTTIVMTALGYDNKVHDSKLIKLSDLQIK